MPPVFSDPTRPVPEEEVVLGGERAFSPGGFDAIFQLSLPLLQQFSDTAFRSAGLDALVDQMPYELQNLPPSVRGAVGRALQAHQQQHSGPPYFPHDPISFGILAHRPQLQTLLAPDPDAAEGELGSNAHVTWDITVTLIVKKKPQMTMLEHIILTRGSAVTAARVRVRADVERFATWAELEFLPKPSALESELDELLQIGLAHSVSEALEPLLGGAPSRLPHTFQ